MICRRLDCAACRPLSISAWRQRRAARRHREDQLDAAHIAWAQHLRKATP